MAKPTADRLLVQQLACGSTGIPQADLDRLLGETPSYRYQFAALLQLTLRVTRAQFEQHGELPTVARAAFCLLLISQGWGVLRSGTDGIEILDFNKLRAAAS